MKIGIIGFGHVGNAMKELFKDAIVYDCYKDIGSKEEINNCDTAFVCVPTPSLENGGCDTSIVENVLEWIKCDLIVLRSTVKIGFTDTMMRRLNKEIVFQPEYYGETAAHPFRNLNDRQWLTFGGTKRGINMAINTYKTVCNSSVQIYQADAKTVEMAKYMENSFLATKVTFCNEMYEIASKLGVNYNEVREIWLADPRIGASHTFVYEDKRGFGGSCLPKDVASIISQANEIGADTTLLQSVVLKNKNYKKDAK